MAFWISMFCANLLIPLLMILFGVLFQKYPPKEINGAYGYRTTRSMKTQEAWDFAQNYFAKLWLRWGLALLPITILPMLFVLGKNQHTVGIVSGILCGVLCVLLCLPIFFVERALKQNFDENGKRK